MNFYLSMKEQLIAMVINNSKNMNTNNIKCRKYNNSLYIYIAFFINLIDCQGLWPTYNVIPCKNKFINMNFNLSAILTLLQSHNLFRSRKYTCYDSSLIHDALLVFITYIDIYHSSIFHCSFELHFSPSVLCLQLHKICFINVFDSFIPAII